VIKWGVRQTPPARTMFEASLDYISFGHYRIDFTTASAKSIGSISALVAAICYSFVVWAPPLDSIVYMISAKVSS
jgi:hypothetical protein